MLGLASSGFLKFGQLLKFSFSRGNVRDNWGEQKTEEAVFFFIIKLPLSQGQVPASQGQAASPPVRKAEGTQWCTGPSQLRPQTKELKILSKLAMLSKSQTMKVFRNSAQRPHP